MKKTRRSFQKIVLTLAVSLSMLIVLATLTLFVLSIVLENSTFREDLQPPNRYTQFRYLNYITHEMQFDVLYNDKKHNDIFFYFHGNVGRLDYILQYLNKNTTFMAIAYPGYHRSTGKPSVSGTLAAVEALANIINEKFKDEGNSVRFHLIGHSLGTQTAAYFAGLLKDDPRLSSISMVGGFPSIRYMCENTMGIAQAVCFIAKDSFDAVKYLTPFNGKHLNKNNDNVIVRVFHLPSDSVVPYQAGKDLYLGTLNLFGEHNTRFIDFTGGSHGEFDIELVVNSALSP